MSIKIYNTLTRTKEPFVPLEENRVKMYVCGPTVYNHMHIGNARPVIFFDTVRRYLEYRGYQVTYIQNFTDVDDKIIKVAQEEGITAEEVANTYIKAYFDVAKALNVREADYHPRVTETMDEIILFIQQLIERGLAYETDGDVYYRTNRFNEYGKLSHQKTDELMAGARVDVSEKKESPLDFALWKKAKPNEPYWESPWGKGRPGWHIECSAMIRKHLGDTIDIHGGGADLTFPHHENEIAQSEGLSEKPLANYWMHNAMITINEEKMSKSLGNFIQVKEIVDRYDPQAFRFFMLSGHYRSPINYSEQLLAQAKSGLERLKTAVANLDYALKEGGASVQDPHSSTGQDRKEGGMDSAPKEEPAQVATWRQAFEEAMDDDFNTANAISALFELVREANTALSQGAKREELAAFRNALIQLGDVLGLTLKQEELLDEAVEKLIEERNAARKAKDYAKADRIRDMLLAQGIILEDTAQGTRWRRK